MHRFVEPSLRLVNRRHVVRDFDRVLHHALGLFEVLEGEVEFSALAVNLGHVQVGLCVFRIRVGDDLVLFERGVGLAVVHQVLGQSADRVEIVAIDLDRAPI